MRAVSVLFGHAWRRHWRSSLLIAAIVGIAAGVIGATFQAAARANTSFARFEVANRIYDRNVYGCPPGIDPETDISTQAEAIELCLNPEAQEKFRAVVDRLPGVENTAVASVLVVGMLDPAVSNGWGRLALLSGTWTPGATAGPTQPIVVAGRMPASDAADEVGLSEVAARSAGIRVGDVVQFAGWRQRDLDAAIDGTVKPQTKPFSSKVVGILRGASDVQASPRGVLSDVIITGDLNVIAGPAWLAAHGRDFSGYGANVVARLRDGPNGIDAFQRALEQRPEGWWTDAGEVQEFEPATVERIIDVERQAMFVFAALAIPTVLAFVALVGIRLLRRDENETAQLWALGLTRKDLRIVDVARSLSIGLVATVLAALTMVALSPFGPVGLARKLEFDLGVRIDFRVLAATVLAVLLVFLVVGFVTPVRSRRRQVRPAAGRARFANLMWGAGPLVALAGSATRRRTSVTAIAAATIAVAAVVGAGGLVASFDRLDREPLRYGAWWDVVVGQYSDPVAYEAGVAKLRANDSVVAAAGFDSDVADVGGESESFQTAIDVVGHTQPVLTSGRLPRAKNEVALGRDTARRLGKGIGDEITVKPTGREVKPRELRVTGTVIINDAIAPESVAAGRGGYVTPEGLETITGEGSVPQSIGAILDPAVDQAAAIESVRHDFPGSIRGPIPQTDVRNLGRLRSVPWLITAFILALALVTLVLSLLSLIQRERSTLAVAIALGLTPRQRRRVCLISGASVAVAGITIGVPLGLLLAARVWRALSEGIGLPSDSVVAFGVVVVATTACLAVSIVATQLGDRRAARQSPATQLRAE